MKHVPRLLAAALLVTTLGCASSQPSPFDSEAQRGVELIVYNRLNVTITAYVQWGNARPVRLDEVGPGETESFVQDIRGSEVRVVASSVGVGGSDSPGAGFASVRPGDRLLWEFAPTGPRPYRRLPAVD